MTGPRAVIVGASVAGLASACALAARGWSLTMMERRPDLLEGGRAFLLQPNGLAALDRLGALGGVRERGLVVSTVIFYERSSRPAAVYDYGELSHPHACAMEIRPQALRLALAERAEQLGVGPALFGHEAVDLIRTNGIVTGVRCRDGDGAEIDLEADLVIGADGPGSRVRSALGIGCRRLSDGSGYVLGTVDTRRASDDLHVFCGAGYANGVAPLPDGTYFWDCVTDANRAAVEARDLDAWRASYAQRVPCAGEFVDAVARWDDLTVIEVRPFWAAARSARGVALVGDAAGAVHPHAAQGANLALEDAVALGDALMGGAGPGPVSAEGLASYARERHRKLRRYVIWSLVAARSLDGPSAAWRAVRRTGWLWNRVGPMRRELLRRQAGLA